MLRQGRYEVGLLWQTNSSQFPNNWSLAEKRLKQLKKQFECDPEFAVQYKAVMDDYIAKGYTVKLSKDE